MKRLPLVIALAAALALAGCSAPSTPSGGTDGGDEGSTQQEPNESSNDGVPTDIPATWPSEVTIPDGEVVGALDLGTGWAATVKVDDPKAAFEATATELKNQGFEVLQESTTDAGSLGVYENDAMQVQVSGLLDDGIDGKVWHVTIVKKG
jgi:hypothetical protein